MDVFMNGVLGAVDPALASEVARTTTRALLGGFFVLARFRWVYDPSKPPGERFWNKVRHDSMAHKVHEHCGYPVWTVPLVSMVEILAGLGVFFGFLTSLSAFGLLVILAFATYCTAREKVMEQKPVDKVDVVCCYLWRVEALYIAMALTLILSGGGHFSLDYVISAVLGLK